MVKKVISKELKINRFDTNLKIRKKVPTKSELELQVKHLEKQNEALEERHKKNVEVIDSFEGKIKNLEREIEYLSCRATMFCKETQTETNMHLKCEECNFESETTQ